MTIIRVLDFETTGLAPPEAAVCEVGWYDVAIEEPWLRNGAGYLTNPGHPIPPEAMAVHHIYDSDVVGAPRFSEVVIDEPHVDIFAAHMASFERGFFSGNGKPWICTLKVARRLWPKAPAFSNQALRYWRGYPLSRSATTPPHRALPDAYVTAWIVHDMLALAPIEDMIRWTEEPSLLPQVTFGKHKGKEWSDLPLDYLDWIVAKSDLDDDTKFTARHWLKMVAQTNQSSIYGNPDAWRDNVQS